MAEPSPKSASTGRFGAATAAPTYFEPAKVTNMNNQDFPLIDGGVFANNPTMCALSSARRIYPNKSRFLIVSLGTGETRREIPYKDAKDWGLLGWARPLLYVLFDGVSDAVDYHMKQEFNHASYFRFQIELGANPDDEQAPNDDMDDARPENIKRLVRVAEHLLKKEKNAFNRLINQLKGDLADINDIM